MFPSYPQHIFFKFIEPYISRNGSGLIVDAPCGSGYITYKVAGLRPGKVLGVDLAEEAIQAARQSYQRNNLEYAKKDIHDLLQDCGPVESYLLINSIFQLPRPAEILQKIYRKLEDTGRLFVVIPNIRSANFKSFQKLEPHQNTLILDKEQAISYFRQEGFKMEKMEGVAFTRKYGNKLLPLTWKLKGLYTYTWDSIGRALGSTPSYFGYIFSKL
jgi:2-polyprenyl-3-methyl-5-hydroxy-6-metoxy-1,4-benzoquinol methylase